MCSKIPLPWPSDCGNSLVTERNKNRPFVQKHFLWSSTDSDIFLNKSTFFKNQFMIVFILLN